MVSSAPATDACVLPTYSSSHVYRTERQETRSLLLTLVSKLHVDLSFWDLRTRAIHGPLTRARATSVHPSSGLGTCSNALFFAWGSQHTAL